MGGALELFEAAAGDDGELDMSEAEAAAEVVESELSSGDELAQESSGPDSEDLEKLAGELSGLSDLDLAQKPPKGEGSGSGSGPDSEDLEALADELDGDDLAQESGPGPKDLPSDIDSADLKHLPMNL